MPVVKPYTLLELRTFVETDAAKLVGGQLQEIVANDRGLALRFWLKGEHWLLLDLLPQAPFAFVFDQERSPFAKGLKPKPLGLFLNSHARGKWLVDISLVEGVGRAFRLEFSGGCEVDVHLIPKHPNVFVRFDGKQISWEKPAELPPLAVLAEGASRDLAAIRAEWLAALTGAGPKPSQDPEEQWRKRRDRDIEKKKKALSEIEKQLSVDGAREWYARGDELKSGAGTLIDARQSRSWNIEQAYAKAKQAAAKRKGTEDRAALLRADIAALESATFSSVSAPKKPAAELLRKADVKGRTLPLDDGVVVFMGKSGADNLALLRRSRAWDYWLHLRDYPGAHAIVHRRKEQAISDADLQKAAQWLAREAVGVKVAGGRLEVVLVECRHVRPLKGDRLGRVTYHNERHFFVDV